MPHPQQVPMICSPFDTHLAEARRLDSNHKYAAQLNELNKQHKFVLLRFTYGGDYKTEMRQSLLVDRLFLIYEKLHPEPVVRLDTHPIAPHNDRLECCPSCKGTFVLLQKMHLNFTARDANAWKKYLAPSSAANASTPTTKAKSNPKESPQKATASNTFLIGSSIRAKVGHNCFPIK